MIRPVPPVLARCVLAVALLGEILILTIGIRVDDRDRALWTEVIGLVVFLLALAAMRFSGLPARSALGLVVGVGAVLQLCIITHRPASSDDAYRYVWDGKVQLSGTDPYQYPPSARELDPLRSAPLFPVKSDCSPGRVVDGRCSALNRPTVRTVYPPVAEAAFTVARLISFGATDGLLPLQILAALGVIAISLLLARRAAARGSPPWHVAVWAWCPVTAVELSNNAHIDWLAALLGVGALLCSARGRPAWAGGLLGAAIVTKIYPGLLLPSLLRRRPVLTVSTAAAVVVLSYVPHVVAVGTDVIGYLPDYLKEESYTTGHRFLLLRQVMPDSWTAPVVAIVLLATALWAIRHTDADAPEETAMVMVGMAFLLTTPNYSWYSVLLLVLVAMTGRIEWFPIVVAATLNTLGAPHFSDGLAYRTTCYALGLLGLLVVLAVRRIADRSPTPQFDVGVQRADGPR
ncbi:MAG: glycosyltransferase 87 family protein [Jatrophihabitans sp.]